MPIRPRSLFRARSGFASALTSGVVPGVVGALFAGSLAGLAVPAAQVASAADATVVVIDGHGYGHGVGLSQWGAYGYAVDHGWTSGAILDHYYGGTVAGTVALDTTVNVRLTALDGIQTAVVSPTGGLLVDGVAGGPWKSVLVRDQGGARYAVWARGDAEVCPGSTGDPVATGWTLVNGSVATSVTVRTQANSLTATSYGNLAGVCDATGKIRAYRGIIRAVNDSSGNDRTVNEVPVEQYLRSVVAKEVSPSWANAGSGRGAQAVQAQAVAARSYALAENRYAPYARTCDTTSCQVYSGAATRTSTATGFVAVEHPLSDAAVTATAGVVRRVGTTAGPIAYAMFSASSGGYTAPGSGGTGPFPAVVDEGDDTVNNPNFRWQVSVTGADISAGLKADGRGDIGTFQSVTVTGRNGFGDWGGRVTTVRVVGSARTLDLTGDQLRLALDLKSTWFAVQGDTPVDPCAGRVAPPVTGPLPAATAARYTALVDPTRLIDTRTGVGTDAVALGAGCTLQVDPHLAAGATAAVVNLTAVAAVSNGYVTASPCGVERPVVSAVQVVAGRAVAGASIVSLGSDGTFCVYSSTTTHLLVDLMGSYAPSVGSKFEPITAVRLVDTRNSGLASPATPVVAPVLAGRPFLAGATSVAITLHATGGPANGFATVYPCDRPRPGVSSINVAAGVATTNHLQVALGDSGQLCVYVSTAMHIAVDLSGWFGGSATTEYRAITPVRLLDTRPSPTAPDRRLLSGQDRMLTLAGVSGLPAAASVKAFAASVTAVNPTAAGYILVHACLASVPPVSMARYVAGSNAATVVVNSDDGLGRWCLRASNDVHVIVDVSGYYA